MQVIDDVMHAPTKKREVLIQGAGRQASIRCRREGEEETSLVRACVGSLGPATRLRPLETAVWVASGLPMFQVAGPSLMSPESQTLPPGDLGGPVALPRDSEFDNGVLCEVKRYERGSNQRLAAGGRGRGGEGRGASPLKPSMKPVRHWKVPAGCDRA
ncbi:hypothetical protein DL95DRAFT_511787 [Leptodontidium sp. 2 PMI_412]|nr:hypothetical protein DL95DRAFT_511787 [Leptodontidium sp. 2 PMI_412]